MHILRRKKPWALSGLLLLVMILGICSVVYAINSGQTSAKPEVEPPVKTMEIPVVGTVGKLQELLTQSAALQDSLYGPRRDMMKEKSMANVSVDEAAAPAEAPVANGKADYSGTNVQVQGVDEADIVKTDGNYIYMLNQRQLSIVRAIPADKMQLVAKIKYDNNNFNPRDLYVDAKHLIVIGDAYRNNPQPLSQEKRMICPGPPQYSSQTCKAVIYNLNDKTNPAKNREIELEGYCLSTRKVGSSLYLVANRNIDYYRPGDPVILPSYRDSATGKDFQYLSCDRINYFPDCLYNAYVMVVAINTDNLDQKVDIKTYLGNGDNIYASPSNLYIAVNSYPRVQPLLKDSAFPEKQAEVETEVYRFALQGASTVCTGKGTVPGAILNQFSMDEHQGFLRIATTSGDMWNRGDNTSKNHIYVLDKELKPAGKLENIAPGEKIYSTRFMGDRAYMVTFRNVDPFFVIDLKNPQKPQILGKLKIPGYSDYLHPYDENHIIGFGKDTVEMKGWNGESQAFYQGLKIAVFDVTRVDQPVEMSRAVIGDRGTDSELLNNHKALLFSKEKNLLAFPVTLMELGANNTKKVDGAPAYGSFTFQGAYIYNIDLKNGLQYKGRISHLESDDYQRAGDYWYESDNNIKRVLYIGNVLYTVSPGQIKAQSIADLKPISSLKL